MNNQLTAALQHHADALYEMDDDQLDAGSRELLRDTRGLIKALRRMVEGMAVRDAFGAPGDWGYNTAIGKALTDLDGVKRCATVKAYADQLGDTYYEFNGVFYPFYGEPEEYRARNVVADPRAYAGSPREFCGVLNFIKDIEVEL